MPVRGIPLESPSNLRLLVSGAPPFVLDVDRGRTRPIRSTPDMRSSRVVLAQDVGGRAAVIGVDGFNSTVYILRGATAAARRS